MNVAEKVGSYRGFTGKIKFDVTDCIVKNADFDILEKKIRYKDNIDIYIDFHKGVVKSGELGNADIKDVDMRSGRLIVSVFRGGTLNGTIFERSVWIDGVWRDGIWDRSYDKFLCLRGFPPTKWGDKSIVNHNGIANQIGNYQNFNGIIDWNGTRLEVKEANFDLIYNIHNNFNVFIQSGIILQGDANCVAFGNGVLFEFGKCKDCEWASGTWEDGEWDGGYWEGGTWVYGVWENGIWESGNWLNGIWKDGTWCNGTFNQGLWHNGTWEDGEWLGGTWQRGFNKYGFLQKKHNSPDKWSS